MSRTCSAMSCSTCSFRLLPPKALAAAAATCHAWRACENTDQATLWTPHYAQLTRAEIHKRVPSVTAAHAKRECVLRLALASRPLYSHAEGGALPPRGYDLFGIRSLLDALAVCSLLTQTACACVCIHMHSDCVHERASECARVC